jgi:hypothetical protein
VTAALQLDKNRVFHLGTKDLSSGHINEGGIYFLISAELVTVFFLSALAPLVRSGQKISPWVRHQNFKTRHIAEDVKVPCNSAKA